MTGRTFAARAIFALICGSATAAGATSLEEALSSAYDTNPNLIASRAGLRATDERVNQARAGMRPQISGDVSYGASWVDSDAPGARGINRDDPFTAGVTLTQPLYDGGRTSNSVKLRIDEVSAARARLVSTEQRVLLSAVTAYFDVVRDRKSVTLASNNVRVLNEQLRAARDRFEVGEVTRTDASQAEARRSLAVANQAAAKGRLVISERSFRQVTGLEPGELARRRDLPPLPASLHEALERALANHPDIEAARFDESAARRGVRVQMGGLLPTVSLNGRVQHSDAALFGGDNDDRNQASLTINAQIPIYQGGANYSRVRQAQALASQAQAGISSTARDLQLQVENAWSQLSVARATIAAGREAVRAAQLAFEGVREEAIVGSRTTLDVLDSEQELLNTRTTLVSSERDEMVAAYTLLAAIGELTVADLGLRVDQPFDPDINYQRNNARLIGFPQTEDTVWEELWRP